ncbi:hypothetical protein N9L19_00215 [bacterium]|nr:hypothetical protein [bacterium]
MRMLCILRFAQVPRYAMEEIVAGSAYMEGWEDAEASIGVGIDNGEALHFAGSAQVPKRASGRMLDESELGELQQEQRGDANATTCSLVSACARIALGSIDLSNGFRVPLGSRKRTCVLV